MRDLKTLLEILLEEWQANYRGDNMNNRFGLCTTTTVLNWFHKIDDKECIVLHDLIRAYLRKNNNAFYLFNPCLHNERVEWLKDRIKELEQ